LATPSSTPEQQRDAIRETLRLIGDLSDALATQLGRVERLSGELPSGPAAGIAPALADDAARIKQHCEQLREAIDREQERARPPAPSEADIPDAYAREPAEGGDDAVRSLAIEMKLEGRSQSEVKEYLGSTFGRADASRIVDEVFAGETK
jgi:hypothetical protein